MTEKRQWQFYGRKGKTRELEARLQFYPRVKRNFSAIRVRGRRGTGKTVLMQHVQQRCPADLPFIFYEMPDPEREPASVESVNRELLTMAGGLGLEEDMQALLPAITEHTTDTFRFMDILKSLMTLGTVVVFDEFHHARKLGLVSYVKQVIDRGHFPGGRDKYPGRIVLMGSHQQKIDELFTSSAPLYQRVDSYVHLSPWKLPTVMEMAFDQGILFHPGKFLTLWTAYGGMPYNWERYCTDSRYEHLHSIADETEWRKSFLEVEGAFLTEPGERFDARAFIEINPSVRDILLWFGRAKPQGAQLSELPRELGTESFKLEAVELLRLNLALMDRYGPLLKTDDARWRITDQYTLFQVCVFRELMAGKGDQVRDRLTGNPELERLNSLEGHGMETLAEAFLAEQEGVSWHQTNVWHPAVAKEGDIDIMAADTDSKPIRVWLGEAKRNARQLNPTRIRAFQDRFLSVLGDDREARDIREGNLQRILFAPVFSRKDHQHFASHGFQAMDIHGMARSFGLDPAPEFDEEPEATNSDEPRPTPFDDDGFDENAKGW